MCMLRHLDRAGEVSDVVHLHSARDEDDVIFGDQLRDVDRRCDGFRLHLQLTGSKGRMGPETSTSSAPTGASARPTARGPGRCSTR